MDKVKLQIDILKTKITFFTGLAGGVSYLFLNIEKLKVFNTYFLYILFAISFLYSLIGVFNNLSFINDKYKELEDGNN